MIREADICLTRGVEEFQRGIHGGADDLQPQLLSGDEGLAVAGLQQLAVDLQQWRAGLRVLSHRGL